MKLGMDEEFKAPCMFFSCIFARSAQGWIKDGAKIGYGGLLKQNSSSEQTATATNRMHSNDLEACVKELLFLVPFQSHVFDAFIDVLFDSGHLA